MTGNQRGRALRVCCMACLVVLWAANSAADGRAPNPKEAKVSAVIEIINSESNHLFDNYAGYTKRLTDVQKGPTCKEIGSQHWVSSMGEIPERTAKYRKALKKPPVLEIDAEALQMVDALDQLYKPVAEAAEYYFNSAYNKDSCKRGIELHPVLMSGWTKYMKAEQTVRAFLDKYTDERDAKDLGETQKKYGKGLHYYHSKIMVDAKALIRVADSGHPDAAAIRTKLAAFEPDLTEVAVVAEKEKKDQRKAEAMYEGGYDQMLTKSGWFKDSIIEVLRVLDLEAKDPKAVASTNAHPSAMKGLMTAYNSLVEESNKVLYSKSMK